MVLAAPQDLPCDGCHEVSVSSLHGDFGCISCHSNVQDLPHQDSVLEELSGGELCSQCHDSAANRLKESVHDPVLDCQTCHGEAHSLLPVTDLASPVSPLRQIQVCSQCHDSPEIVNDYLGSVHGRALVVSGLIDAPTCSDCHGSHAIFALSDTRATASPSHSPQTCGNCHAYIFNVWLEESTHGQAWQQTGEGPVCATCHSSHQVLEPRSTDQRLKFPEGCGGCHGERYTTYRDSFHGEVTDLGFQTAAICSDCHTPHANLPADNPKSTVHASNLKDTCGTCHDDASAGFLTFAPHNDPTDPGDNREVYYIWVLMTALLVSVFGFFGLHDALWFQRSLVDYFMGGLTTARKTNGPYIKRFSPLDVWIHVAIVVSFLILAATGLPLKFHYTEWAKILTDSLGGVGFTRLLHRFAAVVTFGYALFHLGYLVQRIVLRKDFGLLWGWRSMVPRPKDFVDLWHNLRYFLYFGPRPRLDRWTYWEKFDYFAVFWGIIIIGLSGLVLWFPSFFTRFFPGWFLNAAFLIHSDEALLAVGFIFMFHFFHAHLRPESFPLDPVIFTGRVPLSRFKEERPVEYQRLVQTGSLETRLVAPPTREQIRMAGIFGFAAMAVGIGLMLAILWSFVAY